MNAQTNTNFDNQKSAPNRSGNYDLENGFISIDGPIKNWKHTFPISMLRLARILTVKEAEKWGYEAAKITRLLDKHRGVIPGSYSPMQIRELFWHYSGEIRGGGYKVEWEEIDKPRRRNYPPQFSVSFTHLYKLAESTVSWSQPVESITTH